METIYSLESELYYYRGIQQRYMASFYTMQSKFTYNKVAESALARARKQLDEVNTKVQELVDKLAKMGG